MTDVPGSAYDWSAYFGAVRGQPPRDTLLRALDLFDREPRPDAPRLAVDLGAGTGRDSLELARRGWRVLAIDADAAALAELSAAARARALPVQTLRADYEEAVWPDADLVNASFSIPHTSPEKFAVLWDRIVRTIRVGGRFAGQLFGVRDSWAAKPDGLLRTYHSRPEVDRLLGVFHVEHLDEVERPGKNALGEPKDWHVFHIVGRKRA